MYTEGRHAGLGAEVQRRVLMGTYALSAGYYDAYYRKAQQVRTLIQRELRAALGQYSALLSPAAPTAAYRLGEKASDPLTMYKGAEGAGRGGWIRTLRSCVENRAGPGDSESCREAERCGLPSHIPPPDSPSSP